MAIPTYTNFDNNTNHLSQARKAFDEVRLLLGKANSALLDCPHDQSEQDRFVIWFGEYSEQSRDQVYEIVNTMLLQLSDRPVTVNHGGRACALGVYAYVEGAAAGDGLEGGPKIYLCHQFFMAPFYGDNSQVGTILHETSHAVGDTEDLGYGRTNCRQLAQYSPTQARSNANNYEFYIESFKNVAA